MKKTKNDYFKLVAILIATFLMTGCVNFIDQYSPRRTLGWRGYGWKEFGADHYKYECNRAAVGVYPIQTKPLGNAGKPVLSIDIHNSEGIQESCKVFFLWLENTKTGQRVNPIKVDTYPLSDKTTTLCYYTFDIHGDKNVQYSLHISEQLLGCSIDPIPYIFEKTWEVQPQQLM